MPGPLLALVVSETITRSVRDGIKVALAPVVTDLPIVGLSLFLVGRLSGVEPVLGGLSILGAAYLCFLAYEALRAGPLGTIPPLKSPDSLFKGVLTNFLSPHPYMFWMAVGAPTVIKGYEFGLVPPLMFIVGFYLFIVGAKIGVALIVGRFRDFLRSRAYVLCMRVMGLVMLVFALLSLKQGLELFGLWS